MTDAEPLPLQGKKIAIAGRFDMSRADLTHLLESLGASVSERVSSQTDYLLCGESPGRDKPLKASRQGVPLMMAAQLHALWRGEAVVLDDPQRGGGEERLDALIGEARSLLDERPSHRIWSALVAVLDACHMSQQQQLSDYINARLEPWQQTEQVRRRIADAVFEDTPMSESYRELLWDFIVSGQGLRVAPDAWLGEAMRGVEAPKHEIVKRLDLTHTSATRKGALAILTHPRWRGIERLEWGRAFTFDKKLIHAVCEHENFKQVKYLSFCEVSTFISECFAREGRDRGLETLDLSGVSISAYAPVERLIDPLTQSALFATITSLVLGTCNAGSCRLLALLVQDSGLMPSLRSIAIRDPTLWSADEVSAHLAPLLSARAMEKLSFPLLFMDDPRKMKRLFSWQLPETIMTLEVDNILYSDPAVKTSQPLSSLIDAPERKLDKLLDAMCEGELWRGISRLEVGCWAREPRLRHAFARHHPHIVLA